jgi:4-hydroxy-L-threonine phosphate dehydrogenase PdxA
MNRTNGNNSTTEQLVIGVTMGDPAGIGPEVVVKALVELELRRAAKFIIFGMDEQLAYAADRAEIEPFWGRHQHEKISRDYPFKVVVADYDEYSFPPWIKRPSVAAGESSIRFCLDAIAAARAGIVDAIVTAPINKTSWKLAGADQLEIGGRRLAGSYRNARRAVQVKAKSNDVRRRSVEDGTGHDSRSAV